MNMSPHLSLDIQVEIIKRLPVKSLIQFRSVCKAWKSFIDSSHFIAGYNVCDDQPQHLMISYGVGEENEVKYVCFVDDDTFPQQKFFLTNPHLARATKVIGSSHGLLCFFGYLKEPDGSVTDMAVLWNPSIRKAIAVALPDQRISSKIGFGVCPDTKDPKLVNITYTDDDQNPCKVMVFTLSSGEWTTLCTNQLPLISIHFGSKDQMNIGQFIYWVAGEFHKLILSFDLSTDEFREVHLPDPLRQSNLTISKLRESLVLLDYYNINPTTDKQVCDVWMMEHGGFTKLFTINAQVEWTTTVGFRNNGEPIIVMYYDDDDDEDEDLLGVYDPCLEHIKNLGIRGNIYTFSGSFYMESLILLNHDDGQIVSFFVQG